MDSRAKYNEKLIKAQVFKAKEAERGRAYRARLAAYPVSDGLEDEFGQVPEHVLDRDWYDQVAVDRTVQGHREVGRRLTPLELVEVIRIRALTHVDEDGTVLVSSQAR